MPKTVAGIEPAVLEAIFLRGLNEPIRAHVGQNPYIIWWTGWKSFQSSMELAGQWIAAEVCLTNFGAYNAGSAFYATTGGVCREFQPGQYFDISVEVGYYRIVAVSDEDLKTHECRRAFEALLERLSQEGPIMTRELKAKNA